MENKERLIWRKRCTDRKAAHFSALNCAEQRNPPEKERRGRGPSRWQGTVATVTQRGENNEGLEWCFMSHQDAAMRPMSLNGNAAVSQKQVRIRILKIIIFVLS